METLWQEKHPTATMDIKQLNNQQYSIMKKHLLSVLNDTAQEEWDHMNDSLAKTPNVLVNEPPLFAEHLPTDIQSLRQKV